MFYHRTPIHHMRLLKLLFFSVSFLFIFLDFRCCRAPRYELRKRECLHMCTNAWEMCECIWPKALGAKQRLHIERERDHFSGDTQVKCSLLLFLSNWTAFCTTSQCFLYFMEEKNYYELLLVERRIFFRFFFFFALLRETFILIAIFRFPNVESMTTFHINVINERK